MFNISNIYAFAGQIGASLVALLIVSYFLCWIGQWVWAFLDDEKVGKHKLSELVLKLFGYVAYDAKKHSSFNRFKWDLSTDYANVKTKKYYDNPNIAGIRFLCYLLTVLGLVAIPLFIAIVVDNLHISMCVGGFITLAFVSRGGRRLQKKINTHISDNKAHKPTTKEAH